MLSVESSQGHNEFISEIASLSNIKHENLVKLHGGCVDGPHKILVYDYMENNSLSQTLLGIYIYIFQNFYIQGKTKTGFVFFYFHEGHMHITSALLNC